MDIFLSLLVLGLGVIVLLAAAWHEGETAFVTMLGVGIAAMGLFFLYNSIEPTIEEKCTEHCISYELVETVAENTDYTVEEVTDFFIIVSDDMEAWDAIKLLDSSLTDEQVNAIMEISAMKQEE